MIYRYYRHRSSKEAIQTVRRLLERGRLRTSEILTIRGAYSLKRGYRLTIRTQNEQWQFSGFAWFYQGQGPRALQLVLRWLLIPQEICDEVTEYHHYHGNNYNPNSFFIPSLLVSESKVLKMLPVRSYVQHVEAVA